MLQKQAMPRRLARQKVIDFTVERRVREFESSAKIFAELASAEVSQADRKAMIKGRKKRKILECIATVEIVFRQMIDDFVQGKECKQAILDYAGNWKSVAEKPINHQFVRDFLIYALENTQKYSRERQPDREIDQALQEAITEFKKVVNLPKR